MASKQDVPAFDQLFNPTLTVLRELGGSGSIREIEDGLADRLNLPAEVAELLHGDSGAETELGYRAAWARTYLKNAGHVDNSIRGVWALTPKGASVEEVDPKELVREVRRAQGERKRTEPRHGDADKPTEEDWKDQLLSVLKSTVVRRIIDEHWNNKNAAIVSELFASNVSLDTPDGVLTGLEGASSLLQAYETAFPDFHNTTDDLFAEGNQVVFRWTFTGTNSGPFGDIAATGKQVRLPGCIGIFRLDGGKVNQGHLAWDKYALFQQLGVIPSSTSASAEAGA